jgi:hypothetical protein
VNNGKLENIENKELYMHDMYIDVSWVEVDGTVFSRSHKLLKCGFNEKGEIVYRAPMRKPFNLYD